MSNSKEFEIVFDAKSYKWDKNLEIDKLIIRHHFAYLNDLVKRRGYVFVRDVYENLGIPITKESIVSGWHKDGKRRPIIKEIDCKDDCIIVRFIAEKDITNRF